MGKATLGIATYALQDLFDDPVVNIAMGKATLGIATSPSSSPFVTLKG